MYPLRIVIYTSIISRFPPVQISMSFVDSVISDGIEVKVYGEGEVVGEIESVMFDCLTAPDQVRTPAIEQAIVYGSVVVTTEVGV